ncbi:MAG: PH domain-containing protein, partial [Planctomycetota bacterium]
VFGLLFSFIGIPLLLPWFFGYGSFLVKKWHERLECVLTEKALKVKRGYWFRVEKTIPLDKVQDLTLHEGPLLRKFGISMLLIETAGGSASAQSGAARLTGIIDSVEFRNAVLDQRDRVAAGFGTASKAAPAALSPAPSSTENETLAELKDSVLRIEALLRERS